MLLPLLEGGISRREFLLVFHRVLPSIPNIGSKPAEVKVNTPARLAVLEVSRSGPSNSTGTGFPLWPEKASGGAHPFLTYRHRSSLHTLFHTSRLLISGILYDLLPGFWPRSGADFLLEGKGKKLQS
jgi:hypothetical protein